MRIQKYLSQQKVLSRREAEKEILAGHVKINGKVVTNLATQIEPDKDNVEVTSKENKISILFYKPRGVVSSKGTLEGTTVFDLLPQFNQLNLVGRLDKESEGLIILTNDGVLANIVTSNKHLIEKEYRVYVEEKITQTKINGLSKLMHLQDGIAQAIRVKKRDDYSFDIVIKEGRNHQVRRMSDKVNLSVIRLIRTRIGIIKINGLQSGQFRELSQKEVHSIKVD